MRLGLMTHAGGLVLAGVITILSLPAAFAQGGPLTCEVALGGSAVDSSLGNGAIARCCLVDAENDYYSQMSIVDGGIYSTTGGQPFRAEICGAGASAQVGASLIPPDIETDPVITGSIEEEEPEPDP